MAADGYVKSLCDTKKESKGATEHEAGTSGEDQQPGSETTEPTEDESNGKHVNTRDRDVYMYYFRAIGKLHTVIFLLGGICFAVLLKFPGSATNPFRILDYSNHLIYRSVAHMVVNFQHGTPEREEWILSWSLCSV